MISRVLRYNLINDVVDLDPNSFVSLYPTMFSASGQVPQYLYKSLKSLWLGTSAASGDLAGYIVADTGVDQETPKGAIVIEMDSIFEAYNSPIPRSSRADDTGCEITLAKIVIYKPRIVNQPDLIYNTTTRVKMILDQYYRNVKRKGMLTIAGDIDISHTPTDTIACFHLNTDGPGRVDKVGGRLAEMTFRCEYKRIIL